jgi:hypothetical protein
MATNPITTIAAQEAEREQLILRPEQQLLPFAEKEYIDAGRACGILGVGYSTLQRMAASGMIDWVGAEKSTWKRVRYQSIVDFCERLRQQHRLPDRRPALSPSLRHRDCDLLPFALDDTVSAREALKSLGLVRRTAMVRLIEEGRFEAYQLVPQGPWRISRPSLLAYLHARQHKTGGGHPYTGRLYKGFPLSPHF